MKPCKRGHNLGRDPDGHCSECRRASITKSYRASSEQSKSVKRAATRAWEERNPELKRSYRSNSDIIRKRVMGSALSRHFARELNAIYAARPEGNHVDHIHPLAHKDFCGLHVPWNLQYLPELDNLKKGNSYAQG